MTLELMTEENQTALLAFRSCGNIEIDISDILGTES